MKHRLDVLPAVLFELSVMRENVQGFGSEISERDAARLLSRVALLESKTRRLLDFHDLHAIQSH